MKINQNKVELAIDIIANLSKPEKGLPNALKGDVSSFGASIIQAGLLPSVLFFSEGKLEAIPTENDKKIHEYWDDTKNRRSQLMNIIFKVGFPNDTTSKRPLFDKVRNANNLETLNTITEAALAVKIALRAFEFDASKK